MRHYRYEVIPSTSDRAKELAAEFPGRRLLISAETQTAGRGRSGRRWSSGAGGAWFSVVWPVASTQDAYVHTPLVVGLSVLRVVRNVLSTDSADRGQGGDASELAVKWPNDVLLDDRKLAGVLCEWVPGGVAEPVLVIGVGVNVNNDTSRVRWDHGPGAVSLAAVLDTPTLVVPLVERFAAAIERDIERFEATGFSPEWSEQLNAILHWRGREVAIVTGGSETRGELKGIDASGRVLIRTSRGTRSFDAGELRLLDTCSERSPQAHPGSGSL